MPNNRTIDCLLESDIDPIELKLRNRLEDVIAVGDFEEADKIERQIANLDDVPVCSDEEETEPLLRKRNTAFAMLAMDRIHKL